MRAIAIHPREVPTVAETDSDGNLNFLQEDMNSAPSCPTDPPTMKLPIKHAIYTANNLISHYKNVAAVKIV